MKNIAAASLLFLPLTVNAGVTCDNVNLPVDIQKSEPGHPWSVDGIVKLDQAQFKLRESKGKCNGSGVDLLFDVNLDALSDRTLRISCAAYPGESALPEDVGNTRLKGSGSLKFNMHLYVEEIPGALSCRLIALPT